jgi:hypothetical protein
MIDMNKQYRTLDGREVKLLMTDGGGSSPVVGAVRQPYGTWDPVRWPSNGLHEDKNNNLVEVKPKHVRWLNCYADSDYESRESADRHGGSDRIACIRIEFEEGEGLS